LFRVCPWIFVIVFALISIKFNYFEGWCYCFLNSGNIDVRNWVHLFESPCIVICYLSSYTLFFHAISHTALFSGGKKGIGHDVRALIFSTTFDWKISHSKKNSARYGQKCTQVFVKSTRHYFQILMKIEFFGTDFRKILKYQISWQSVQWEPSWSTWTRQLDRQELVLVDRQPDRHTRPS
jgi:hypothetical protein